MKAIHINGNWKLYATLPKVWNNKQPYNAIEEGFKDVVKPTITNTERLGMVIYDEINDIVTYQVVDKTEEEIFADELRDSQIVSGLRLFTQLELIGITRDDVLLQIDNLPDQVDRIVGRNSVLHAVVFDRNSPLINGVGALFEKTPEEMDEIFINANKLPI
jgi:hypothetical protein